MLTAVPGIAAVVPDSLELIQAACGSEGRTIAARLDRWPLLTISELVRERSAAEASAFVDGCTSARDHVAS